jgi:folate-binding protein YgfZ
MGTTGMSSYREFLRRGGIADLSGRAILRFGGNDRARYLNGQVTANVQSLQARRSTPACVTSAKGKLCADGFVTNTGDALWFDAEATLRETLAPRFERYIISDDVTLEDLSDSMRVVHFILGEGETAEALQAAFASLNPTQSARFGRPGLDFLLSSVDAWDALKGERVFLTPEDLESLRVEAGIPKWGAELDENTLPPEAGLDRTHIDYHKGCYIGQEVISRLKSIGHVNRRLVGFISSSGTPLEAGWEILAASGDAASPAGTLTSAARSFALEKPLALGYLRRAFAPGEYLARPANATAEPTPVTACELPFTK